MFDFPFMHVEDYGFHEFRSLNGRVRVRFRWEPPHSLTGVSPVSLTWPRASRYPVARRLGDGPVQAFPVVAVTQGDDTARLAELLDGAVTVGLVHSPWACRIKECQIPEFQIVHVTGFPRETTEHTSIQTYRWDLECVPADPAQVGEVPTWTWGDIEARYATWGEVEATHATWAGVEEGP